ncbi:MAG: MBL fold metallo-hydrolase [Deltaproteobacteria bacterium]|nr:MBL fold metallo-hydrolase [Deltaproteobacteria bacterium]
MEFRQLFKNIYFFEQCEVGPFHSFSYIIGCQNTKKACLIDPGWEPHTFQSILKRAKLKLHSILLTHHHPDQTQAVLDFILENDPFIYLYESQVSEWQHLSHKVKGVKDKDHVEVGHLTFQVHHTPGHTLDSLCFELEDKLFTGDTLQVENVGRCDLPESDATLLYQSLYEKIKSFLPSLKVYPGHHYGPHPHSTLQNEFQKNPYLQFKSLEEFIRFRK